MWKEELKEHFTVSIKCGKKIEKIGDGTILLVIGLPPLLILGTRFLTINCF